MICLEAKKPGRANARAGNAMLLLAAVSLLLVALTLSTPNRAVLQDVISYAKEDASPLYATSTIDLANKPTNETISTNDNNEHGPATTTRIVKRGTTSRQRMICNASVPNEYGHEWARLCQLDFVKTADGLLNDGRDIHLVQIGAHIGFEANDPFGARMAVYLRSLSEEERRRFHWTFVEPSPPTFKRLQENVANHSHLCHMDAINTAIVSDATPDSSIGHMTFYSIGESISRETGYDTKSKKMLPRWFTQLSTFSRSVLDKQRGAFRRHRLKLDDYVVEMNVTTMRYSDLMQTVVTQNSASIGSSSSSHKMVDSRPLFVMIDTEGFDCAIVCGISNTTLYRPDYLLFEDFNCHGQPSTADAYNHLQDLGYRVKKLKGTQNTIARLRRQKKLQAEGSQTRTRRAL